MDLLKCEKPDSSTINDYRLLGADLKTYMKDKGSKFFIISI